MSDVNLEGSICGVLAFLIVINLLAAFIGALDVVTKPYGCNKYNADYLLWGRAVVCWMGERR